MNVVLVDMLTTQGPDGKPQDTRGACFCVARPPPNIGEHRKGSMLACVWELAARFGYYDQLFSHRSWALSRSRRSESDE
jgi:hypothetical protein